MGLKASLPVLCILTSFIHGVLLFGFIIYITFIGWHLFSSSYDPYQMYRDIVCFICLGVMLVYIINVLVILFMRFKKRGFPIKFMKSSFTISFILILVVASFIGFQYGFSNQVIFMAFLPIFLQALLLWLSKNINGRITEEY